MMCLAVALLWTPEEAGPSGRRQLVKNCPRAHFFLTAELCATGGKRASFSLRQGQTEGLCTARRSERGWPSSRGERGGSGRANRGQVKSESSGIGCAECGHDRRRFIYSLRRSFPVG
eukprot:4024368-Pyramimonas_sp.AAC.1